MAVFLMSLFFAVIVGSIAQALHLRTLQRVIADQHPEVLELIGYDRDGNAWTQGLRLAWLLPMSRLRSRLPDELQRSLSWHMAFNILCVAFVVLFVAYFNIPSLHS